MVDGGDDRGRIGRESLNQHATTLQAATRAAGNYDLPGFASQELPEREAFGYPPFASMIRLVIRGGSERTTLAFADELANRLRKAAESQTTPIRILGPAPAPMAKLRDKFRFQLQLQTADGELLRQLVRSGTRDLKPPDDVAWIADVDPIDMM